MDEIIIIANDAVSRLDKFISENSDISRSYAAKLIEDGCVTVNLKPAQKKTKVATGDEIRIALPEPQEIEAKPENIPIDIVYEDDSVIVVNKPQGMVVLPAAGNMSGTLVNGLLFHCSLSSINGAVRPGIVHRIDKDTSGLLVVAKTNEAHEALSEQLKERKALRKYYCIVNGNIKEDSGTVDKPIGRHPTDRKRMAIIEGGRDAVTHFKVLERFGQFTLVECTLETGRTHQIRVHMASLGHNIVGDPVYGVKKDREKGKGQLLHAKTIGFKHPKTGEIMEFTSNLPEAFTVALEKLRNYSKNSENL